MEGKNKFSRLKVRIVVMQTKFTVSIKQKPTWMILSIIPLYFFPFSYKCGMIYTLAYRYPRVCYDWTRFHVDLTY